MHLSRVLALSPALAHAPEGVLRLELPVITMGTGPSPLVTELGLCLLAAGFLSAVFERLRIPTIAALLGAGVILGPSAGLGLVHSEQVETIASLGLTLLLFVIGLEVNPRALLASGRTLLVTGALQVPLTLATGVVVFFALSPLLPASFQSRFAILYLGIAGAFSSTLLVVRALQERRWTDTLSARLAVGLLIFQDIWAIIALALQPSFESPKLAPIALTFAGIFMLVALATLGARYVLPSLFAAVAKLPDLIVSVALAWCFCVGLAGSNLGSLLKLAGLDIPLSVSLEMGALIAGMTIASFPYHHDVASRVSYLRDFFVTLFFVALGMSIPVPSDVSILLLALLLSLVAVLVRVLVFFPLLYFTGLDRNNALDASLKLGQISEFCLVIVYLGQKAGHVDGAFASVVIFAFVITALLTPLLMTVSRTAPIRCAALLDKLGFKLPERMTDGLGHLARPRIVVLGFHRVGFALLQDISRQHPEWLDDVLVVDINVQTHAAIRELGARVIYGDAGNPETLRHAHVDSAQLVISTVPDELLKRTSNEAITKAVRAVAPNVTIFACASRADRVEQLYEAGASYVYMPSVETANGVMVAAASALLGKLEDFRVMHEASSGPLTDRGELGGMSV
ncbi:MAG: putative Glutathione-regulated potassium-efflux system protein [Myxococcaceae bacterium]|nr:putative Glutathione-regulated potassium-efflux system protein [Myxococcaceae bacterium]